MATVARVYVYAAAPARQLGIVERDPGDTRRYRWVCCCDDRAGGFIYPGQAVDGLQAHSVNVCKVER